MALGNDVTLKVGFDIDKFQGELRKTNGILNNWSTSVTNSLKGIAIGFTAIEIGKHVIKSFAEFQYEMSKVKAVTQATEPEFQKLRDNAIDLGRSYGVAAKDAATLQLELARLGFSTKEILDTTKSVVLLAKATGEDLALSAQTAGSVIRSFNLDASEASRVTDVMAAAFNKSALGLSDFSEAIKYVAPVAANAGLSIEQVSALLGVLADNGIKGSMAGTSLRKIISDLGNGAAPVLTKELEKMASQGLSGAQAMDEVGRTAYASLLILSKNTEKINEATEAYKNSTGELQKMSDIMTDNLIGDWNKLTGSIDAFIQKTAESKDGPLRWLTQSVTGFFNTLSSDNLSAFEKFAFYMGAIANPLGVKALSDELNKAKVSADEFTKSQEKFISRQADQAIETFGFNLKAIGDAYKLNINYAAILAEVEKRRDAAENAKKEKKLTIEIDAQAQARKRLIAQIFRNIEIQNKFNEESSKSVTGGLPSIPQPDVLPGKVGSPFGDLIPQDILDANATKIDQYNALAQDIMTINEQIRISWMSLAEESLVAMATAFGGGEPIGKAFLKSLAQFGIKFGAMLIKLGIANIAIGNKPKGVQQIAAGVALVAAGAALASSSAASGSSGAGRSGVSDNGGSGRGSVNANTQSEQRLVIQVVAKGNDLVGVYDSAKSSQVIRRGG